MDSDHQILEQGIQVWAAYNRGTTCPTCPESQTACRVYHINCLTTSLGMNSKRLGFSSSSSFLVVTALGLVGSVPRAGHIIIDAAEDGIHTRVEGPAGSSLPVGSGAEADVGNSSSSAGPMQVTLAPALAQVGELEVKFALALELVLADAEQD